MQHSLGAAQAPSPGRDASGHCELARWEAAQLLGAVCQAGLLWPSSLAILSLAGLELLRAAVTRWTSLKASWPRRPAPGDPAACRWHRRAPGLATSPWKAQESRAELSSWHSPWGSHRHRLLDQAGAVSTTMA